MNFSIFDSILDGVLVLDEERRILYANQAVATLCGIPLPRIKHGNLPWNLLKFEDTDLYCMPGGTWGQKRETAYREVCFTTFKGNSGRALVSIRPKDQTEAGTPYWITFLRDMTLEESLHRKYRGELEKKERVIEELKSAQAKLQDYSKNLEIKVQERTVELNTANRLLSAIVNSLGQGFLIFDEKGSCLPVYSKACEDLLETKPASKLIWEVLRLAPAQLNNFRVWMQGLFEEMMPFEDVAALGPGSYQHTKGKRIKLEFYPMRSDSGKITGIVLVATDKTAEHEANQAADREREYATMVVKVTKYKDQFLSYLRETNQMIGEMREAPAELESALRAMHTIKGGAALFSMQSLKDTAHQCEDDLIALKKSGKAGTAEFSELLQKDVQKVESEMLSFFRNNQDVIGLTSIDEEPRIGVPVSQLRSFYHCLSEIHDSKKLQHDFVTQFLREPIQKFFSHFDTIVSQIAMRQGKNVAPIHFEGSDIRVIGRHYSRLFSSLTHVFRNIVDHGIECPDARIAAGKVQAGQINVRFSTEKTTDKPWLKIQIEDDGRGIDPDAIRKKLHALGQVELANSASDDAILQVIFQNGFTTREAVTDISGRGVGLNAVLFATQELGGTARIRSRVGLGTQLLISVPDIDTV